MGILRVDHLEVYSSDIDRPLDFYVNTLGFNLWRRTESGRDDGSGLHPACVRLGDMMVEIIKAGPEALDQPVDQSKIGLRMFALPFGWTTWPRPSNTWKAREWSSSRPPGNGGL